MGKTNGGTQYLRTGSCITVYVILLLRTVTETVKGDALISSWLLNCTLYEDNKTEEDVDCLKKIMLQLSILNGKSGESDTVETFVTTVRDHGGESRNLEEPYRITIYKSDIYTQYPLEYIQSFDGFPHEVELFAPDCKDSSKEKNPNCGWVYTKAAEKLEDSQVRVHKATFMRRLQGFCCLCTLKDKLPPWLGGDSSSRRSKQNCNSTLLSFLNLFPFTRRGSAHCFRHSTQWYPTYQIGLYNQSFTIRVVAHLVYSSREAPSLSKTYFGKSDVSANTSKWLALPKSFYTLDGSECDKIGVSFNAFRSQVQPCSRVFQSCFGNQLHNYAKETESLAVGENPLYAVSRYGKMFASLQTRSSILNLLTNQTITSLLSLELKADDLKFFVYRSPGKIMEASIELPIGSLSDGLLKVEILNTGRTTANFTLHTEECPLQLKMSTVQVSSLKPRNVLSSYIFNLSETDDISYHSTCRVFLQDNMGDRTDVYDVKFDYPSREEFAYFLRDETEKGRNSTSWFQWFWDLFNWTRWFGSFNTTFNWCWFFCPNNTLETQSSSAYRCEHGEAVQGSDGYLICPDAPQNATGFLSIFNWTPCGECRNIVRDFGCYVKTLCWKEILAFLLFFGGIFFLAYLLWLLHQAGMLGPLLKTALGMIRTTYTVICGFLSTLFTGRRAETSDMSDMSDSINYSDGSDDDGGKQRRKIKVKRRSRIAGRKTRKRHHKKKGFW